jgi:RNA polymerase sigma factor (sigma-70 family)
MGEIKIKWFVTDGSFEESAMMIAEYDIFQLALRYKIPNYDPEDIAQELRWELWKALPNYDPKKAGLRTFVNLVCRRRLYKLIRGAQTHKRVIHYNTCPMDEIGNIISDEQK